MRIIFGLISLCLLLVTSCAPTDMEEIEGTVTAFANGIYFLDTGDILQKSLNAMFLKIVVGEEYTFIINDVNGCKLIVDIKHN